MCVVLLMQFKSNNKKDFKFSNQKRTRGFTLVTFVLVDHALVFDGCIYAIFGAHNNIADQQFPLSDIFSFHRLKASLHSS